MIYRVALKAASFSLLAFIAGCQHKQSNPPVQATAPVLVHEKVEVAKAVHVGPANLYPDPKYTVGKPDTLSLADLTARYTSPCPSGKADCTYSQSHRDGSASLHKAIYDEHNVAADKRNIQDGEVDHLYPMCAGGANDATNPLVQPADNKWKNKNFGYHEKDALEAYVCRQIVAGKLDPKDAYNHITTDWVAYYLQLGLDKKADGEDEDVD